MKDEKMLQQEAAQQSEENIKSVVVLKHSFPEPSQPWTAKEKKRAVYVTEKDGKKVSIPVHTYLKQEAAKLPPMVQNGKRVVHFDELWWRFMHGNTRQESVDAVVSYCREVVEIWNKAVEEEQRKPKLTLELKGKEAEAVRDFLGVKSESHEDDNQAAVQ